MQEVFQTKMRVPICFGCSDGLALCEVSVRKERRLTQLEEFCVGGGVRCAAMAVATAASTKQSVFRRLRRHSRFAKLEEGQT